MGKFSLEKISINQEFNYMIFFCLYKFLKTKKKKQNGISTWNEFTSFSGSSDNNIDGFGGGLECCDS